MNESKLFTNNDIYKHTRDKVWVEADSGNYTLRSIIPFFGVTTNSSDEFHKDNPNICEFENTYIGDKSPGSSSSRS